MSRADIHPDFDGHNEKSLKDLEPKEKLLYLSQMIELYHTARTRIKRVKKISK